MGRFDMEQPLPFRLNQDILDREYSGKLDKVKGIASTDAASTTRSALTGAGIGGALGGGVGGLAGIRTGGSLKQKLLMAAVGAALGGGGGAGIGALTAGSHNKRRNKSINTLGRIENDPEFAERHRSDHDSELHDQYMQDLRDEGRESAGIDPMNAILLAAILSNAGRSNEERPMPPAPAPGRN
jgi:hypothetical protein